MNASPLRERMIQLYSDGYSLQEVGDRVGCTREWVRLSLASEGIARRHNGRAPQLGELAMEVFGDLEDQFPSGATVAELSEWIGEPAPALRVALGQLITAGWATVSGTRYRAHTAQRPVSEAAPRRPPPAPRVFPCVSAYGSRSLGALQALHGSTKGLRELASELGHNPAHLRGVLAGLHSRGFIRAVGRDRSVAWRANLWTATPAGVAHALQHSTGIAA